MKKETLTKWQPLIEQQPHSGLSVTDYCKHHNLSQTCFYKYKSALNQKQQPKTEPAFIKAQPVVSEQHQAITIHCHDTRVTLPLTIEPSWLARFIKALA